MTSQSRIGLGCMALTGIYGAVDRETAIATIRRALDLGIDHFDTAELYGPYTNESLLAEALGSDCRRVTVATKFGYRLQGERIIGLDSRPEQIRRAVDGSLRRLKRETIDLLYQHRPDPAIPVEDVVGAMADLLKAGKVRALGLSATDEPTFQRARATYPIIAVQNEYSMLERVAEQGLLQAVAEVGAVFVAHSPLGRGLLTGNSRLANDRPIDDYRRNNLRFTESALRTTRVALVPLFEIAADRGVTPASVALAWILATHPAMRTIPGARTPEQLEMSYSAISLVLTPEERRRLSAITASAPEADHGA